MFNFNPYGNCGWSLFLWVLQHVFPFFTDLGRRFAGEVAQDAAEVRHGGDAEPVADLADGKVGGMKKRYGFFGQDTVFFLKRSAAESTAKGFIQGRFGDATGAGDVGGGTGDGIFHESKRAVYQRGIAVDRFGTHGGQTFRKQEIKQTYRAAIYGLHCLNFVKKVMHAII